jgi:hypothetical protein
MPLLWVLERTCSVRIYLAFALVTFHRTTKKTVPAFRT